MTSQEYCTKFKETFGRKPKLSEAFRVAQKTTDAELLQSFTEHCINYLIKRNTGLGMDDYPDTDQVSNVVNRISDSTTFDQFKNYVRSAAKHIIFADYGEYFFNPEEEI